MGIWRRYANTYASKLTSSMNTLACWSSATPSSKRDNIPANFTGSGFFGDVWDADYASSNPVYSRMEPKSLPPSHPPSKRDIDNLFNMEQSKAQTLQKRAAIPYLPGSLFCPAAASDLDSLDDNGCMCCVCDYRILTFMPPSRLHLL